MLVEVTKPKKLSAISATLPKPRPTIQPLKKTVKNHQQVIVIPQNMLVNGRLSSDNLRSIISLNNNNSNNNNNNNNVSKVKETIRVEAQSTSLKRPSPSSKPQRSDSCYGSDSENGDIVDNGGPVRKRANLDHLTAEEKLMRRKLKNRVAAQNARDKKRVKMEDMEAELERIRSHAKTLELRNARLVEENRVLTAENDRLKLSTKYERTLMVVDDLDNTDDDATGQLVASRPFESAEGSGSAFGMRVDGGLVGSVEVIEDDKSHVDCVEDFIKEEPVEPHLKQGVAVEKTSSLEDLIKLEDEDIDCPMTTETCENFVDEYLSYQDEDASSIASPSTILDIAWENTFNDLFPSLDEY